MPSPSSYPKRGVERDLGKLTAKFHVASFDVEVPDLAFGSPGTTMVSKQLRDNH